MGSLSSSPCHARRLRRVAASCIVPGARADRGGERDGPGIHALVLDLRVPEALASSRASPAAAAARGCGRVGLGVHALHSTSPRGPAHGHARSALPGRYFGSADAGVRARVFGKYVEDEDEDCGAPCST
jgi:hypothetical protein